MNTKRELLLEKNQLLDSLSAAAPVPGPSPISEGGKEEKEEGDEEGEDEPMRNSSPELIDDIMFLNEEVEVMDSHVTAMRKQLQCLNEILRSAQFEDVGERDEHQAAAELAIELVSKFTQLKDLEFQLHEFVKSLEELRKQHSDVMDTPLQYMLQLPPLPGREEVEEKKKWIHTLPDQLTGKTNCEMRIEMFLLKESCESAERLRQKLAGVYSRGLVAHRPGWQQLLEELAGYDFVPLQDQWLQAEFR